MSVHIAADVRQDATWSVVDEVGVDYAPANGRSEGEALQYPAYAEVLEDGSWLIVDELAQGKGLPVRAECRTLCVDAGSATVFDSREWGMPDAYGVGFGPGVFAVLRRTLWEIWLVSRRGMVIQKAGLAAVSKRMPRTLSRTDADTLLVTFVDRVGEVDIAEVDRGGRLRWLLPSSQTRLGCPGPVQLLESGNLLLADEYLHVAREVDREGRTVWEYGTPGDPSAEPGYLSGPKSARAAAGGRRVITDSRNHRVVSLGPGGGMAVVRPARSDLTQPSFAELLPDGHYLVCDAGNRRVVEWDRQGEVVREFGAGLATRRTFSFPRSVEVCGDGATLVCDTANDRVVEVAAGSVRELPFGGVPGLFWPRSARKSPTGTYVIADGRNSRILEVSGDGRVLREVTAVDLDGGLRLGDPHDVRVQAEDRLLVVDPAHDVVMEIDWSGRVYRSIGRGTEVRLKDPHSAQPARDGTLLITDTGNDRVVVVDERGRVRRCVEAFRDGASVHRFHRPRYAVETEAGTLVVADTGNNRVLGGKRDGSLLWELAAVVGSRNPFLSQPRWVCPVGEGELLVCDHYHHRVLHLTRRECLTRN
jgi:hypothetical protein